MKKLILLLLFVQSFSYSQDISLDDLLNIRSIPEFKLLAFENSFVLNKTSDSKTNFYYEPSYRISKFDNEEYLRDSKMDLGLTTNWVVDEGIKYITFALSLNYDKKYVNENSILRERMLKSIKNKCTVETIYYWQEEITNRYGVDVRPGGRTNVLENSTGEIGLVEYSCENRFGEKVLVSVDVPDLSYWVNFSFINKEATGLVRDSSFTLD